PEYGLIVSAERIDDGRRGFYAEATFRSLRTGQYLLKRRINLLAPRSRDLLRDLAATEKPRKPGTRRPPLPWPRGLEGFSAITVREWRARCAAGGADGKQAVLIDLSTVTPEPITYLWPGRLPRGKLILFGGDPGNGKSYLSLGVTRVTIDGGGWPDGGQATEG